MTAGGTLELMARIGGGLLVVVALVFVSARVARRVRGQTGDSGLRVIDRVVLSREAHLAVVEADGRRLLLGVTPQQISLVGTLGDDQVLDGEAAAPAPNSLGAAEPQVPDYVTASTPAREYLPDSVSASQDDAPLPTRHRRRARHAGAPPNDAPEQIASSAPAHMAPPAPAPMAPPAPVPMAPPAPMVNPAPRLTTAGLDLSGHPDLASALRAAGRTTGTQAAQPAQPVQPHRAAAPVPGPQPRADARTRAEVAEAAAAQALIKAAEARGQQSQQAKSQLPQNDKPASVPLQRRQASGSVLSPATWRQGIEALRELTVRRG